MQSEETENVKVMRAFNRWNSNIFGTIDRTILVILKSFMNLFFLIF